MQGKHAEHSSHFPETSIMLHKLSDPHKCPIIEWSIAVSKYAQRQLKAHLAQLLGSHPGAYGANPLLLYPDPASAQWRPPPWVVLSRASPWSAMRGGLACPE